MPFDKQPAHYRYAILAILPATILMYFGASCGVLLTPDSEQYLSAAREITTSGRWPGDHHSTYLYWPPLFPLILSVMDDPASSLRFFNGAILVAIGFLNYALSFRFINTHWIRIAFVAISLLNVHLLMTGIFLWTELVFILLMMFSLFCFFKAAENKMYIVLLVVSLSLLCLQRYAGLLITLGIGTGFLIHKNYGSWKHRLLHGSISIAIPAALVFGWWNYVAHHHPEITFLKRFSLSVAGDNLMMMLQQFSKIVFPVPGVLGMILLIGSICVIVYLIRKPLLESVRVKHVIIVVIFYLSGFVALSDLNADEADRFLSVVIPLVMLIAFFILDVVYARNKKHVQVILMLFICLWMTYPIYRSIKNVWQWHERSCEQHDQLN